MAEFASHSFTDDQEMQLIDDFERGKSEITRVLKIKFGHWQQLSWRLPFILHHDLDMARGCGRECLHLFDAAGAPEFAHDKFAWGVCSADFSARRELEQKSVSPTVFLCWMIAVMYCLQWCTLLWYQLSSEQWELSTAEFTNLLPHA